MSKTKYLKGACQHCGGHLEFLADHIGMVVPCPHCHQETELLLPPPPEEPTVPLRALVWTGIAIVVLGLGFGGALVALKRAQRWAEKQKRQAAAVSVARGASNGQSEVLQPNSPNPTDFSTSSVTLEKTPGSTLVYAVGTLQNTSVRQRFGVKIELELADITGQKIGTASDYRPILEPGAQWQFKALVVEPKASSVRISAIREDQ